MTDDNKPTDEQIEELAEKMGMTPEEMRSAFDTANERMENEGPAQRQQPMSMEEIEAEATGTDLETIMNETGRSAMPDPKDVPEFGTDELGYKRDADGKLLPTDGVIEWNGEYRRITYIPTPKSEAAQLEERFSGEELSIEQMDELLQEKLISPDPSQLEDMDLPQYIQLVMEIMEKIIAGDNSEFYQELADEMRARESDTGKN